MPSLMWTLQEVSKEYFIPSLLHDLATSKPESIQKVTAARNDRCAKWERVYLLEAALLQAINIVVLQIIYTFTHKHDHTELHDRKNKWQHQNIYPAHTCNQQPGALVENQAHLILDLNLKVSFLQRKENLKCLGEFKRDLMVIFFFF